MEPIPSMEKQDGKELWSLDWDRWDLISSGTGDLCLEDLEKSLSTSKEVSKNVRAIDFESIIEMMPSCGFQVENLMPETEAALQTTKDGTNLVGSSAIVDISVETKVTSPKSKTSSCDISLELNSTSGEVAEDPMVAMETIDVKEDTFQADVTTKGDSLIPCGTVDIEEDQVHVDSAKDEFLSVNEPDTHAGLDKADLVSLGLGKPALASDNLDVLFQHESSLVNTMMRDVDFTNCQINEECRHHESPVQIGEECDREDGLSFKTEGNLQNSKDSSEKDRTAPCLDTSSPTGVCLISIDVPSHGKAAWENQIEIGLHADSLSAVHHIESGTAPADNDLPIDLMKITASSSMSHKLPPELGSENQKKGVEDAASSYLVPSLSISGNCSVGETFWMINSLYLTVFSSPVVMIAGSFLSQQEVQRYGDLTVQYLSHSRDRGVC